MQSVRMDEDDSPRSLLEVLAVAYGAIAVVVGLVVVVALAMFGIVDESKPPQAQRVVRALPSPTPAAGSPPLRANPAMATTTYYLVYSDQQARTIAEIHERTVRTSTSRRFVDMFAQAIVLPVATAEDSIAAQDVINQAYTDYFDGLGPWVNVIDTANWCKDKSATPSAWTGVPTELALAIAQTCSAS